MRAIGTSLLCALLPACSGGSLEYAGSNHQVAPQLLPAGAPNYGIFLYWPFDSDSLALSEDVSGHQRTGAYAGTPSLSEPAPNCRESNVRGIFLDDAGQSVSYASDAALTAFSVGVWLKPASPASQPLFSALDAAGDVAWTLELDAQGRFRLRSSPPAAGCEPSTACVVSSSPALADRWYQVSATVEGGGPGHLFVNGAEQGAAALKPVPAQPTRFVFGSESAQASGFRGVIDEAIIYDWAVTASDIAALAHESQ